MSDPPPVGRERSGASRPLDVVQRWFQAVITHPGGVESGIASPDAREHIELEADRLEDVILPSKRLSSRDRLEVYANAYYARLLECLGESFPVLKRTVGEEVFNGFAFGYLQSYPSRSYTLARLAEHFPRHLDETRPDRDPDGGAVRVDWPDFLIDLARLELAIAEVFDGPGFEHGAPVRPEALARCSPRKWPRSRLVPVACLRLLRFRYPLNDYYTAIRRAAPGEDVPLPAAGEEFMVLTRRDFIVRRYELSPAQYTLLAALQDGGTIGEAIEASLEAGGSNPDELAGQLHDWFRFWMAEAFFERLLEPADS